MLSSPLAIRLKAPDCVAVRIHFLDVDVPLASGYETNLQPGISVIPRCNTQQLPASFSVQNMGSLVSTQTTALPVQKMKSG